jgi:peptidyl-prolyl cis-trans isomerase C
MLCFKNLGTPAIAALLMVALPACPAFAEKSAVKTPAKAQSKQQPKEQPKEAPKSGLKDAVARVNGTTITKLELDRAVKVMLSQNQVEQPLAPEMMKQAEAAALEQLISAELLYQEALKLEMKDLDKQVAEKVALNRAKFSSDAELEKALKGVDMTLKDMQDFTRKDIVISNYIDKQFMAKAVTSEADARKFYDENLEKYFKKPDSARASHILIGADEKSSAEERKKAKEKAEAILKRVKAGEDFAAIAKSDSTCPSSAQGGDLGTFGRGQMVPAFEEAAFALKPGEVSGVVETQFGYHIIKLTEKQLATTEKFEDAKAKIMDFLKQDKVQKDVSDQVEALRKKAKIEKL